MVASVVDSNVYSGSVAYDNLGFKMGTLIESGALAATVLVIGTSMVVPHLPNSGFPEASGQNPRG